MKINDFSQNYNALSGSLSGSKNTAAGFGQITYNVNPEDFIEPGMNITGKTGWRKIAPVSDSIRNSLVELVRSEYINNYGKTDGEQRSALTREYLQSTPVEDKLSVGWTLNQIYIQEAEKLRDQILAVDPAWKPGQPFDAGILTGKSDNGFDVSI